MIIDEELSGFAAMIYATADTYHEESSFSLGSGMSQRVWRWAEKVGGTESWFARIEFDTGETTDLAKADYDTAGHSPSFWYLPMAPRSFSKIVADGMKRVCKDFTDRVVSAGFKKTARRAWARANALTAESIYFHRSGSTYGAPCSASVDIRVIVSVHILNDPTPGGGLTVYSDHVRRPNGYAYHHRFNAETWSTYDRCVDELALYVSEFAEPWFAKWREPQALLNHPDLLASTRKLFEEAIAGRANPESVATTLKALGIKDGRQKT